MIYAIVCGLAIFVAFPAAQGAVGDVTIFNIEEVSGSCLGPDPEPVPLCEPGVKVDTDWFRYMVCDPDGACSCATVTVEIKCSKGKGSGYGKGGKKK